jgi:hypothetical protein
MRLNRKTLVELLKHHLVYLSTGEIEEVRNEANRIIMKRNDEEKRLSKEIDWSDIDNWKDE